MINFEGKVRVITMDQEVAISQFVQNNKTKPIKDIKQPIMNKKEMMKNNTLLQGDEITKFQSKVGSCNYFATTTRYDIAYAISRVRPFTNTPTIGASKTLDRILSYLLAKSSFKIEGIFGSKENKLLSYTDSEHAVSMQETMSCL